VLNRVGAIVVPARRGQFQTSSMVETSCTDAGSGYESVGGREREEAENSLRDAEWVEEAPACSSTACITAGACAAAILRRMAFASASNAHLTEVGREKMAAKALPLGRALIARITSSGAALALEGAALALEEEVSTDS